MLRRHLQRKIEMRFVNILRRDHIRQEGSESAALRAAKATPGTCHIDWLVALLNQ